MPLKLSIICVCIFNTIPTTTSALRYLDLINVRQIIVHKLYGYTLLNRINKLSHSTHASAGTCFTCDKHYFAATCVRAVVRVCFLCRVRVCVYSFHWHANTNQKIV